MDAKSNNLKITVYSRGKTLFSKLKDGAFLVAMPQRKLEEKKGQGKGKISVY